MNDFFYYIGILYIIYDLRGLILTFIEGDEEIDEMTRGIKAPTDITDMQAIMGTVDTVATFTYKKLFVIITGVFLWCWLIVGSVGASEHFLFSTLIVLGIFNIIFPILVVFYKALSQKEEFWYSAYIKELKNTAKSKSLKVISVVDSMAQYCIVGYIFYSHFWMQ